jgi:hypothetical protein
MKFFGIAGKDKISQWVKDLPQNSELRVILTPTLPVVSVPTE